MDEKRFNQAWRLLAEMGVCDALGGAEYCRVLLAWREEGEPEEVGRFICEAANIAAKARDGRI